MKPTFKVRLKKLASIHSNLRTDIIEGECNFLPALHHSFLMFAPPLDPAMGVRSIQTSQITEIEQAGKHYGFRTANSTYELEVLMSIRKDRQVPAIVWLSRKDVGATKMPNDCGSRLLLGDDVKCWTLEPLHEPGKWVCYRLVAVSARVVRPGPLTSRGKSKKAKKK